MTVAGIVVARLGSSRLPGKMLYPIGGKPTVEHVIDRVRESTELDTVILATSNAECDTVLANHVNRYDGTTVFRGPESDVMGRMLGAIDQSQAEVVVRICGDNPLVSPRCIDAVVHEVTENSATYAATNLDGSFPTGLDVEAFTTDSFRVVEERTSNPEHREHVTLYYKENREEFTVQSVTAEDVFTEPELLGRDNLRLTLDRAADYELLNCIYSAFESGNGILDIREAVRYIDDNGLASLNEGVKQRTYGSQ